MPAGLRAVQRRHRRSKWTPLNLGANLLAWLDPTTLGLADNNEVSSYVDATGNGHSPTGAATARPLFKTNIQNGLPVVRYDGINDVLIMPSQFMAGKAAGTLLIVFSQRVLNGTSSPVGRCGSTGQSLFFPLSGDSKIYEDFGSTTRKNWLPSPVVAAGAWYVFVVTSAASDWRAYINGSLTFSTGTNTVGWSASAPTIGFGTGSSSPSDQGDVLFSDIAFDTALVSTASRWAGAKWNIAVV